MMTTFTDWDILRNLLLAARWTLLLSLVAFVGGTLVTLPLLFMRLLQHKWLTRLVRGYTALFQGTPLLMQLFLAFFGVGLFGIDVAPWTAASLALTFYTSAFLVDIWYGSIRALPKGQWEASRLSRPDLWSDAVAGSLRRRRSASVSRRRWGLLSR
ncbi:Arginine ABC transporter permease protein ArtM [Pantoea agglomerans]|uniref:Arginine ABC transporter permease protein ArtM n=1 Tax=Enterobacter agglomerans TaxID=549 RepID=A0A379AL07_ENTAG|nr:Arginine ABC transporter permease protein ArtM [Pantoea agglomerans]